MQPITEVVRLRLIDKALQWRIQDMKRTIEHHKSNIEVIDGIKNKQKVTYTVQDVGKEYVRTPEDMARAKTTTSNLHAQIAEYTEELPMLMHISSEIRSTLGTRRFRGMNG